MTTPHREQATAHLEALADAEIAKGSAWFFKTGPGDYGEGDRFRGIRVPTLRKLVKEYRTLPHGDVVELLQSPWHEDRLLALLIWVEQYRRGDAAQRQLIFDEYLAQSAHINNWDLIDSSAMHIVGAHLFDTEFSKGQQTTATAAPFALLTRLAHSPDLWQRRIAIMATFYFIPRGEYAETFRIADLLLQDHHDLIHKAVGWLLREVGKRDLAAEEAFLLPRYRAMPRTMLRYAIEKFPEARRQAYLRGTIQNTP
jgi:3-methyladenine DNA glycosylase AlkD